MKFIEKFTLACRGPIEQVNDVQVTETLLIGVRVVAAWDDNHSHTGYDHVSVRPAYFGGRKAWLFTRRWRPGKGYVAEGYEDNVVELELGIRLIIDNGCIDQLFPEEEEIGT